MCICACECGIHGFPNGDLVICCMMSVAFVCVRHRLLETVSEERARSRAAENPTAGSRRASIKNNSTWSIGFGA